MAGGESLFATPDAKHPAQPVMPRCRCGKWGTYLGNYDANGLTIRCSGCLRAIWECRC